MTAMKQAKKIAEGRNYTAADIGDAEDIKSYSLIHAKTGQEVRGKLFLKELTRANGNIVQQHPARKRARVFPQARQRRRNVHNTPGCGLLSGRRRLLSGQSGERHKGRAGRGKGPVQHLAGGDGLPMHPIPGKFTGKTYLRRRHTGSVYAPMEKTLSRK